MKKLILAEKPSVAKNIADATDAVRKNRIFCRKAGGYSEKKEPAMHAHSSRAQVMASKRFMRNVVLSVQGNGKMFISRRPRIWSPL